MIFPDIIELLLLGVYDRGIPNQERIVLKVQERLNTAQYGVLLSISDLNSTAARPIWDNCFNFTEHIVDPGMILFIYTGPGSERRTTIAGTQIPAHVFHWGKKLTVFASTLITPIIFKVESIIVAPVPINRTQLNE
ncbi:MAG: hypothetical protein PHR77_10450 [Kiritimatiellae bacterium]|nr:hypothetical protein [Kiritimatiellia bacterium]MDD5522745.1 hypothetical protein [Kiritimatiellia bacterium]